MQKEIIMDERFSGRGLFSWNELITTDAEAAKKFYAELLGWELEDMPLKDTTYSVIKAKGHDIGGIMSLPLGAAGALPRWLPYVTVDEVDATVRQAGKLGAKVIQPPMDIPEVGRFAILKDPQMAEFAVITYLKR
jgi:predicted enzyme related to lactoylglutathione lyase